MSIRLWGRTGRATPPMRPFSLAELTLMSECAFQAGRELGWRGAQQLAVAGRRYRTYLILSELQRLEQALLAGAQPAEAAGVTCAIVTIRQQFAAATPGEVAAFDAAASLRRA